MNAVGGLMPTISSTKKSIGADKLSIYDFGRHLLEFNDLDPVYVILWEGNLPRPQLCRWLVAYWCFYSVGVASWLSEFVEPEFFQQLIAAVPGTKHPRGHERRHFRGLNGTKSATGLQQEANQLGGSCIALVDSLWAADPVVTLASVSQRAQRWRGFGPWISFKVADMLDRLEICPVAFQPSDIFNMFDAPREGAELMANVYGGPTGSDAACQWAYQELLGQLQNWLAPPGYDRPINIQEIETILCKWKSHVNGHYPLNNDILEIRHGLIKYGRCHTSQRLLRAGQQANLWK